MEGGEEAFRRRALWRGEQRGDLVKYLAARDLFEDPRFWKLAQALLR